MSLPFETELVVRGVDAVDALKRNLSLFPKTGLWPIILGGPRDLEWIEESRDLARDEDGLDPIQVMEDSRVFDVENWLANCEADRNLSDPEVMGKWPWFPRPNDQLVTHLEPGTSNPLGEVHIGLFRVQNSWEVLAKLLWMAVNFGIGPVEHTAVHRHWARLYGSMVVSVTGDVIQCFVERPPKTKDEALFLAIEQFKYCSDIVDQGVGTICNLAAELLNSHTWYFWWD